MAHFYEKIGATSVILEIGIHFFEKIVPTAVNKRGNPMPTTQKCRPLSRWSARRSHCPELPRKIVVANYNDRFFDENVKMTGYIHGKICTTSFI